MKIEYTRPYLYPKQQEFVDDQTRFTYVEAGTKSGKTIAMIIWLHERSISGGRNQNRWWVAPFYNQAKIAFNRWWNFIPNEAKYLFKKNESELTITYPGSNNKVHFKSAEKPDTLYGEDVFDCVIDEASRMREDSWNAVRSTLTATIGRAKIIGNVKGKKNWFYRYAQQAKAQGQGYYRLTSYDNPFISKEEIDHAKANLPEKVFSELYLSEPTDDGSNPFGIDYIRKQIKDRSNERPICFGVDLAKSFDFTVILGLDQSGNICLLERFQKDWQQTKETILRLIDTQTPALIDSTGVGDAIVEDLQRERHRIEGFKFTHGSKQQLMEGLATGIQQGKTSVIDGLHRDELEAFEFQYTRTGVRYSAPEGFHDDIVCAHALAFRKYTEATRLGKYTIL